jgi:hypothetical protein
MSYGVNILVAAPQPPAVLLSPRQEEGPSCSRKSKRTWRRGPRGRMPPWRAGHRHGGLARDVPGITSSFRRNRWRGPAGRFRCDDRLVGNNFFRCHDASHNDNFLELCKSLAINYRRIRP